MAMICRSATGRSATCGVEVDREVEAAQHLAPPIRRIPARSTGLSAAPIVASTAMFSATVRFGNSDRSWKITWMPSALALRRVERQHRLAVDLDLAGGRRVHPGDRLDQRRLAAAVLADEAVHLAAAHLPVDVGQRVHAAEALARRR